jgi:hypothetical protein
MKIAIPAVLATAFLTLGTFSYEAKSEVTINLWQDGADVRGQAAGTLDLTGLSFSGNAGFPSDFRIEPNNPEILFFGPGDLYSGIIAFPTFGAGGFNNSGTSTGDHFGFEAGGLVVPSGFVSGSSLLSQGIFSNTTLALLGASAGTYTYVLPSDTITVVVGQAPIPEPSSTTFLVAAGAMAFAASRRRRR